MLFVAQFIRAEEAPEVSYGCFENAHGVWCLTLTEVDSTREVDRFGKEILQIAGMYSSQTRWA
jgi:hypothetical protein